MFSKTITNKYNHICFSIVYQTSDFHINKKNTSAFNKCGATTWPPGVVFPASIPPHEVRLCRLDTTKQKNPPTIFFVCWRWVYALALVVDFRLFFAHPDQIFVAFTQQHILHMDIPLCDNGCIIWSSSSWCGAYQTVSGWWCCSATK